MALRPQRGECRDRTPLSDAQVAKFMEDIKRGNSSAFGLVKLAKLVSEKPRERKEAGGP
jgi:hypothetical protein